MSATETETTPTATAKPTWRDLTQAIVTKRADGSLAVILTSKSAKSIERTKAQAISAGLEVLGDGPIVAKNELDIPKPAPAQPAPAQPEATPSAEDLLREKLNSADPRPDLPGKAPGSVPAPRKPRASRKPKATAGATK